MKWFSLIVAMICAGSASAAPRVVADIAPIHGLVSMVMKDVGTPELILPQKADPHHYALRPSQARHLAKADIIFWVGPELTPWLKKPLETLGSKARNIMLSQTPNLLVLPSRQTSDRIDPHFWLRPQNAQIMIEYIRDELSRIDPENALIYAKNAADIEFMTDPVVGTKLKIIAGHDAYQYFEQANGLQFLGAITQDDDHSPSAAHVRKLASSIDQVECVLIEPSQSAEDVRNLLSKPNLKIAVVDPIGIDVPLGPKFYATMMANNLKALSGCRP